MKTIKQIDDAQELARTPIARALVWTRMMPGFESIPVRKVREAVEQGSGNCSSPPASGAVKDDLPVHRPAWR
jgi:hypothetical protein